MKNKIRRSVMRFGVSDYCNQTIPSTKAAWTRSVTHYKRLA